MDQFGDTASRCKQPEIDWLGKLRGRRLSFSYPARVSIIAHQMSLTSPNCTSEQSAQLLEVDTRKATHCYKMHTPKDHRVQSLGRLLILICADLMENEDRKGECSW